VTDALRGAIVAAVNAILACLIAFNVALTSDQQAALAAAVNAALAVWLIARHRQQP